MSELERFDLHMHSTASDGTVDPYDLAGLVQHLGLRGFSLTDHDTVEGLEKARQGALEKGLIFLPGIEISADFLGKCLHVLGYGFDMFSDSLKDFLVNQKKSRNDRNRRMLKSLASHGIFIDEEKLLSKAKGSVGRVHIAQEIVELGKAESISAAFFLWIGDRAPCFVPSVSPSPDVCIRAIHQAGGKVLVAHPHLMESSHVKKVVKGFAWDGLEVFYGRFERSRQMTWLDIVQKKKWVFSGGSDFHGKVKPESFIGSSWIDDSAFKKLVEGTHWQTKVAV